jgi:phosphate-selective porin
MLLNGIETKSERTPQKGFTFQPGKRDPLRKPIISLAVCVLASGLLAAQEKKEYPAVTASQPIKFSAYGQFLSSFWDEGTDSFSVRRLRMILSGNVMKNVLFKVQADVARSPILLDALVEFGFSKSASLRIGQFLVPFSLENLTSTSDLDTINRSQVEEKLCPGRDNSSQGRDIGLMALGKYSIVEYSLGLFNGSGTNKADTNSYKDLGARVVLRPHASLSVGASLWDGKQNASQTAGLVARDRLGLDFAFVRDRISLKGEYIRAKDDTTTKDGWYLQGGYTILEKKLQAVVKFDTLDVNRSLAQDRVNLWTLGANWFLSGKTKLQVNYEIYTLESGKRTNSALLAQFQAAF